MQAVLFCVAFILLISTPVSSGSALQNKTLLHRLVFRESPKQWSKYVYYFVQKWITKEFGMRESANPVLSRSLDIFVQQGNSLCICLKTNSVSDRSKEKHTPSYIVTTSFLDKTHIGFQYVTDNVKQHHLDFGKILLTPFGGFCVFLCFVYPFSFCGISYQFL